MPVKVSVKCNEKYPRSTKREQDILKRIEELKARLEKIVQKDREINRNSAK